MKTFWATVILFFVLVNVVICHAVFLHQTSDGLERRLQALLTAPDPQDAMDELERYWLKKRPILELSLSGSQLACVQERIALLRIASATRDGRFWEAYTLLAEAVMQLRDTERLSAGNLL